MNIMSMINKKIIPGLVLLLLTVAVTGFIFNKRNHHYTVDVFTSEQGWGYNILFNNKLIIHQPFMPAVKGHISFGDKYTAKEAGLLVVNKLQNKHSPEITTDELNSIINNTNKAAYRSKDK
jgi:hypothetical protein